jgi:predicted Rossmann fold nucleotide-binding protein DprA/Smf involved in DNA uptake
MSLFPAQRRHLQKQSNAVRAAVKHLQADLDRPVTEEEIEVQTWLPPHNVTERLKWLEGRGKVRREGDGWVLAEE